MIAPRRLGWLAVSLALAAPTASRAQTAVDSAARVVVAAERDLKGRAAVRRTVAVLPFDMHSTDSTFSAMGYGLAAMIADDLAHSHQLLMVERLRMADIRQEQALQHSTAIDASTAVKPARLIAAQHLVFGSIDVPTDGSVAIDEHVVRLANSQLEMGPQSRGSVDAFFRAERDLVMATFEGFGVKLTPDELRALNESVPPNFRAFLAFSRGTRFEALGNDAEAVKAFRQAASLDPTYRLARRRLAVVRQRVALRTAKAASSSAVAAPVTAAAGSPTAAKTPSPSPGAGQKSAARKAAKRAGSANP